VIARTVVRLKGGTTGRRAVGLFTVSTDPRSDLIEGNPVTNPYIRIAGRALLAAVLAFAAQVQASDNVDGTLLRSALVGAVLAAAEVLTPLNQTVGVAKK
jgi:hypothetical protein